jgi:hypothetical protein
MTPPAVRYVTSALRGPSSVAVMRETWPVVNITMAASST